MRVIHRSADIANCSRNLQCWLGVDEQIDLDISKIQRSLADWLKIYPDLI